jgi:dihydrolipoamide dehydrogenase
MPKHPVYDYDLLVIGSGSGGNVAANTVAKAGQKVAIVDEAPKLGGECPNWACVPTKALLRAAEHYRMAKAAPDYGIDTGTLKVDYKRVKEYKDLVVSRTGTDKAEEFFNKNGIDVIRGHAHFIDEYTVSVAGKRYTAHKFLIATGTSNFIPPIKDIEDIGYITYEQAVEVGKLPKSMAVIGGGAVGCEFATIFNTFDVNVTLFEAASRLLSREEPETADLTKAIMEKQGVRVETDTIVEKVEKSGKQKVLHYRTGNKTGKLTVSEILIAAGKRPNTEIGLENAGVEYDKHGITTNEYMQTSAKHIFAAGDVVGPYQFTHTASYQSRIAGNNITNRKDNWQAADYHSIPRCVFVEPEVASVGLTEAQVREQGITPRIGTAPISQVGRSNTENFKDGMVKVVTNQKGNILGASIIAPHAGEMIHELAVAINFDLHAHEISHMVHAFPTWSEAIKVACGNVK